MLRIAFFSRVRRSGLYSFVLPLLLAGCATVNAPAPDVSSADARQASPRSYRDAIELGGRLSVRYQENGRDQAMHGSFGWMQTSDRTIVTLLSPLGQTIATIDITPNLATLTQAGQAPRTAPDVDALTTAALGWPLPVSGLRDWLQGFAPDAEGRHVIASPQSGASSVATPDGWRIHYASWQDDVAPAHPKRIDLERSTVQAGDVAIRIVIDTWQPR